MNNEPVAWMDEINTFVLDKDYQQFPKSLQHGMIPLYTHPVKEDEGKVCARCGAIAYDPVITQTVKELTDGEIERIYFQTESVWDKDGNFQYLEFARAILRKASEK